MDLYHTVLKPSYNNNIHIRTLLILNKWVSLNEDIKRYFFTDEKCIEYLEYFDDKYNLDCCKFFLSEPDGRFKSDIFRMCILYDRGGLYSDIDQEPLVPVKDWLDINEIDFCTGVSAPSNYISNGIMYSKPQSKILKACLDAHLERYRLQEEQKLENPEDGMSAIHTMCKTIRAMFKDEHIPHGVVEINNEKCLFIREIPNWNLPQNSQAFLNSFAYYANNDKLKIVNVRYDTYFYDKNDALNFVNII